MAYTHIDLFSGIGGFALAARWNGIKTVQFVEIDPFCCGVLEKNFPRVPIHHDIKTFTYTNRNGLQEQGAKQQTSGDRQLFQERPFLLTGGFPCQPFSCAGNRKGTGDDRHLWPHMLRVIQELHPRWVIAENVSGLVNIKNVVEQGGDLEVEDEALDGGEGGVSTSTLVSILSDLEQSGYSVQVYVVPACGVGAPHRRDRVWIVGHAKSAGECVGQQERVDGQLFSQTGREQGSVNTSPPDRHASDATEMRRREGNKITGRPRERAGTAGKWDRFANGINDASDTQAEGLEGRNAAGTRCADGRSSELFDGGEWDHEAGSWSIPWPEVAARLCRVDDGVSEELYKLETSDRVARLKALGNAILPQVADQIIKAILAADP